MSFTERLGKAILDNTILRNSKTTQEYDVLDAWGALISMAKQNHRVNSCILQIDREGDHYLVRMVALNKRGEPIYRSAEMLMGCSLSTYNLSDNLLSFLDKDGSAILNLDTLTTPPKNRGDAEEDF